MLVGDVKIFRDFFAVPIGLGLYECDQVGFTPSHGCSWCVLWLAIVRPNIRPLVVGFSRHIRRIFQSGTALVL